MNRFLRHEDEDRVRELIFRAQAETDPDKARDCYVEAFSYLDVDSVYRFSIARSNKHLAEGIAQEVLLAVYKAMPNFRGVSKVNTWIQNIAPARIAQLNGKRGHRRRRRGF